MPHFRVVLGGPEVPLISNKLMHSVEVALRSAGIIIFSYIEIAFNICGTGGSYKRRFRSWQVCHHDATTTACFKTQVVK